MPTQSKLDQKTEAQETKAAAKQMGRKRGKKQPPEPEPEPEEEEGEEAGEAAEDDPEKEKQRSLTRSKNKRARLLRRMADEAGGEDLLQQGLSLTQAKKMLTWAPVTLNKGSYDEAECKARFELSQEHVTTSAAREVQLRVEALLRELMKKAVLRTVENGTQSIDAMTIHAVLREYEERLGFTGVAPPRGLLRYAQSQGAIGTNALDADEEMLAKEVAMNKTLHEEHRSIARAQQKAKEERSAKLAERKAARAAA